MNRLFVSGAMENSNESQVSVTIITLNEEENIRKCLDSVSWSDDIVVVDSNSSDGTAEIARQYTSKVFLRSSGDFGDQRRFAESKCSNDWVLSIDADERVTDELRDEILQVVQKHNHEAYCIPIANKIAGGWLKHGMWYPAYRSRLYNRNKGGWDGVVHETLVTEGPVGYLKNPIVHFRNKSISDYMNKTNRYTDIEAGAISGAPAFLLARMIFQPMKVFIKNYFVQGCILDGVRGFVASAMRAEYEFIHYAKIWEKTRSGDEPFEGKDFTDTARSRLIRTALGLQRRLGPK